MNRKTPDPHFEFRVFGQAVACEITARLASLSPEYLKAWPVTGQGETQVDAGLQTYILSASNQSYNIKLREHKLDIKLLLRQLRGLERWQPYLQLAFPLTAAFLHEFFFAWLEIAPPLLRRAQYTEGQFLEELLMPNPNLCTVQVNKQRRHYTVNGCQMEVTALTVAEQYHTATVAVEAADAATVRATIAALGLDTFANTNYIVGLQQLMGMGARKAQAATLDQPMVTTTFTPVTTPELVLAR